MITPIIRRDYICFYEGLQEEKYFKRLKELIEKSYPNIKIKFKKVNDFKTFIRTTTDVEKIAIFDYDSNKIEFEGKVKACTKAKVTILYSNLNFDLWLLLHKELFSAPVIYNDDYQSEIREKYELPITADIKKESNIDKILKQIEMKNIQKAIGYAEKIIDEKNVADRIHVNSKFSYYSNPATSVQEFLRKLEEELKIQFK